MSASPSIATLQSLLRSSPTKSASPSSSNSRSLDTRTDLPSTSTTPSTISYASLSYWGSTLSGAFGYGASTVKGNENEGKMIGGEGKGKGKARGGIPDWNTDGDSIAEGIKEEDKEVETNSLDQADDDEGNQELNELVDTILWKASSDSSTAPSDSSQAQDTLLVLACSRIPPTSTTFSHSQMLDKLRLRLERYASTGPYSIVLLANPTPNPPSTPQLVSSYLSLSRTSRKNLQKLWVVGGGWWTRVILTLFNTTLLSLKTSTTQKIAQCADLTSLAKELGTKRFTSVEFPLEVYIENAKIEKEIRLPEVDETKPNALFGVELDELFDSNDSQFPPLLEDSLSLLESQGPSSLGIFRRSPSASTVKILELAYSRSQAISLSTYPDAPYLSASLLKLFLRSLPSPILPPRIWETSKLCPPPNDPNAVYYIREEILPLVGGREIEVLKRLMRVCEGIERGKEENLMGSSNLVVCLAPALIGGVEMGGMMRESVETCRIPGMVDMTGSVRDFEGLKGKKKMGGNTVGGVLKVMIERYDEIFESSPSPSNSLPDPPTSLPVQRLTSPTQDRTLKRPSGGGGVTKTERTNVRGIFAGSSSSASSVSEEEEEKE
ncbi:hypothetical protein JCM5353_006248 [Sporobolomyces roseus]